MTAPDARPGVLTGVLAPIMALIVLGEAALAAQYESLVLRVIVEEQLARRLAQGLGIGLGLLLVGGLALLVRSRRMPSRSPGRLRLALLSTGALSHVAAIAGLAWIVQTAGIGRALESGLGLTVPPELELPSQLLSGLALASALLVVGAAVSCWFMLLRRTRARLWWAIDAVLLVAAVYAYLELPSEPPEGAPSALGLPLLRHGIFTLFLLRLTIRFLPPALNAVEALGFEALVAARHLRSKKSGFLAAISLLSVLAVTVSSCSLTSTLSVMGGFRNDLKRKILGNNAHIVVDREHGNIEGWQRLMNDVAGTPRVTGASPYVRGEVMLSSASNLATAVLRGIDPARVGRVNDLPNNMKSGSLDYLTHPEKLLDLPPDRFRARLMPLLGGEPLERESPEDATAGVDAGPGAPADGGVALARAATADGASDDGEESTSPAGKLKAQKLRIEKSIAELEEFLRAPPTPEAPSGPAAEERDVLPGIVIGQELARALRLFVGDEVNVVAPLGALGPSGPMPKARAFRVAGVFYSGMYEYDMKFTYVSLETAQRFLGVGDAISGVEVRVSDVEQAPQTAAAIRGAIGREDLRVRDWQELNSRLFGALALEKLAMFIALGIAILVASFCIAGTLTLMVQEKGREVAILKAMGTSDRAVVAVFVIEGGLIGLLGSALGLFFGYMACFAAEHFGIRMNPEVYYIDRLPVHMDPTEFALTGVAAVVVCLLVTVYPALLASRLRPVDALRYE